MKIPNYILFFILFYIICVSNIAFGITPSQRAAINIWLQQQQNINPRPLPVISTLKNKANINNIRINRYSINSNNVKINAITPIKSNITKYKRMLDTTFMFEEIAITNTKYINKNYHFNLILNKANVENRGVYNNSNQVFLKSKTQVKYLISRLITKMNSTESLNYFCPASPLKTKPKYIGARIKLIIYSYHIKFSGSFKNIINTLSLITDNPNYISIHNLIIAANKKSFKLEFDVRFYQQTSKRNNIDKTFVYEQVKTDKICE
ncbi:MAG: hypothetical protein ACC657_04005 [Thiohalomonadales bacterium]